MAKMCRSSNFESAAVHYFDQRSTSAAIYSLGFAFSLHPQCMPTTHITNIYCKMPSCTRHLKNTAFIVTASYNPVVSCLDNIQINHKLFNVFWHLSKNKILAKKMEGTGSASVCVHSFSGAIDPLSVCDPKNSAYLCLPAYMYAVRTSLVYSSCAHS